MVLYVVTAEVAPEAEPAWRAWMEREHVPEVLREPGFVRARLLRADVEPGA